MAVMKTSESRWTAQTLSRRAAQAAFFAVVFGFLYLGWSQEPSMAKRKKCTDCHQEIKALINKGKAHQPAEKSCETCHQRHGFAQKLVLVKNPPDLCLDCHQEVSKELDHESVHGALSEGGCTACHDPHASREKALLRQAKGSPTICATCHQDHQEMLKRETVHAPYKKKDCSICHEPHFSPEKKLLVSSEIDICGSCHKDAASKHDIPSFSELSCSGCHEPHLTSKDEPLIASAHAPFATGACDACHQVREGKVDLDFKVASTDACCTCHAQQGELLSGDEGHIKDGKDSSSCLTCHHPHKSSLPALKLANEDELCRTCHGDLPERLTFKGSMHTPFAVGECTGCHNPHGGGGELHLVKASQELCSECHADKFSEPAEGETRHAALDMQECLDCHQGHASADKPLLKATETDMCLSCHDKEPHSNSHPPYLTSACTSCHTNHTSNKGLLQTAVNTICGQCHQRELRLTKSPVAHSPAQEDNCTSCHQAHGGEESNLLSAPEDELCASCHDLEYPPGEAPRPEASLHQPVIEGHCGACHNPHGSVNEKLLVRQGEGLCYGCHTQEKVDFAEGNIHEPVKNHNCGACHTPHASGNPSLTREAEPELCFECHDIEAEPLAGAHSNFDVAGGKCSSCHNPHTSLSEKLINDLSHSPFAEGSCDACHEDAGKGVKLSKATTLGLPASGGDLCLACHDEKSSQAGHQHKKGIDCTTCHTPHASRDNFLLKNRTRLCLSCHGKIMQPALTDTAAVEVHRPLKEGDCLQCHKMHEPEGKNLLVKRQDELCAMCHESVKDRSNDLTMHSPYKKGNCSSCHATHVSAEKHLLKKEEKKLCKTCHSLSSKTMAALHKSIPLAGESCTTCHDPHSTEAASSKLIAPNIHQPMADGDCAVCHDALKSKEPDNSLCLACHDQGDDTFANVHPGTAHSLGVEEASSCLACHSPHAGYESLLKRKDQKATCFQCHEREQFSRRNVHAALEMGCSACHNLHNANAGDLQGEKVIETCTSCHEEAEKHAHPVGPDYKDPRTGEPLTCNSCHEAHSSAFEFLLSFDYQRNLCVQCHAGGTMKAH